jgi:spermidine synthase
MSWLSYIFPRTIAKFSSPYNKEIRINEEKGKLKLLVNGSRQSGAYIEMLWKGAFKEFQIPQRFTPKKILVLGVAGGTVIHLLHTFYPEASIVAVDIDQTMIDVGIRYFDLDTIDELAFVCQDAEEFVKKQSHAFDLIIVDLFIGTHVPNLILKKSFLTKLKTSLSSAGAIIINYLREFEYLEKSEQLKKTIETIFSCRAEKSIYGNRFFFARMVK